MMNIKELAQRYKKMEFKSDWVISCSIHKKKKKKRKCLPTVQPHCLAIAQST